MRSWTTTWTVAFIALSNSTEVQAMAESIPAAAVHPEQRCLSPCMHPKREYHSQSHPHRQLNGHDVHLYSPTSSDHETHELTHRHAASFIRVYHSILYYTILSSSTAPSLCII
ncbi:hypothetical protein EDC01DRAFT_361794 [Geopyxis carbonaria]|nr:hypothetical protein EDC01DRAFT_361794 [Geopyxis carbonaria]